MKHLYNLIKKKLSFFSSNSLILNQIEFRNTDVCLKLPAVYLLILIFRACVAASHLHTFTAQIYESV